MYDPPGVSFEIITLMVIAREHHVSDCEAPVALIRSPQALRAWRYQEFAWISKCYNEVRQLLLRFLCIITGSRSGKSHLTNWGRLTPICVGSLTIIDSDNGLSPDRRQAMIWTNAGISIMRTLGTHFSETIIKIHTFSFKKSHLKMSSVKWFSFRLGLIVLIWYEWENQDGQVGAMCRVNVVVTTVTTMPMFCLWIKTPQLILRPDPRRWY